MVQREEIAALDRAWGDTGESFSILLALGSEHLRTQNLVEARVALERADALKPDDAEVLNLLGLTNFKLGELDRARSIFTTLAERFPGATPLELNVALVQIKSGELDAARDQLLEILQREPSHARAGAYLGMVYEKLGDPKAAIAAYRTAGNHGAVRRIERQLDESAPEAIPEPAPEPAAEPAFAAAPPPLPEEATSDRSAVEITELVPPDPTAAFTLLDGLVHLRLEDHTLLRSDRWVGRFGELGVTPVFRRQRGKETEQYLGGEQPVVRVEGRGRALLRFDERTVVTATFDEEIFVAEPRLLALQGDCHHETGRLVLPDSSVLHLLRLRGEGTVVLLVDRVPARMPLKLGPPLAIQTASLVAFTGKVLPQLAKIAGASTDGPTMLNLLGEGDIWVDGGTLSLFEIGGGS